MHDALVHFGVLSLEIMSASHRSGKAFLDHQKQHGHETMAAGCLVAKQSPKESCRFPWNPRGETQGAAATEGHAARKGSYITDFEGVGLFRFHHRVFSFQIEGFERCFRISVCQATIRYQS